MTRQEMKREEALLAEQADEDFIYETTAYHARKRGEGRFSKPASLTEKQRETILGLAKLAKPIVVKPARQEKPFHKLNFLSPFKFATSKGKR